MSCRMGVVNEGWSGWRAAPTGGALRGHRSSDFQELARFWQDSFGDTSTEFPLSMFNGSDGLDVDTLSAAVKQEFS